MGIALAAVIVDREGLEIVAVRGQENDWILGIFRVLNRGAKKVWRPFAAVDCDDAQTRRHSGFRRGRAFDYIEDAVAFVSTWKMNVKAERIFEIELLVDDFLGAPVFIECFGENELPAAVFNAA